MKPITFYLDFLSPYAYLAFEQLPEALEGLSYSVAYRPVFLGGVLKHHGTRGPAEVPGKREWTYRQVLWLAHAAGIPMRMPASHPYNPLPHLRLALATSRDGDINRYVAETVFREVWRGGAEAADPARLAELAARLQPVREPDGDEVKAQLRANTQEAVARSVFGTPSYELEGRLFWGVDALPMLRACLAGDPWFDGGDWDGAAAVPDGLLRR